MNPYEAAFNMFQHQHTRWNQWALFFFGAIASIFVIADRVEVYVQSWAAPLFACLVSIMWINASITIMASTHAWHNTLLLIESTPEGHHEIFRLQKEEYEKTNRWKEFCRTFCFWDKQIYQSLSRMLILFGVLSAICFFSLFLIMLIDC